MCLSVWKSDYHVTGNLFPSSHSFSITPLASPRNSFLKLHIRLPVWSVRRMIPNVRYSLHRLAEETLRQISWGREGCSPEKRNVLVIYMYKINIHQMVLTMSGLEIVRLLDHWVYKKNRWIRVWREGEKKGRREGKKGLRKPREISILHASMIYSTTTLTNAYPKTKPATWKYSCDLTKKHAHIKCVTVLSES